MAAVNLAASAAHQTLATRWQFESSAILWSRHMNGRNDGWPDPSPKRTANGGPAGFGLWCAVHLRQRGSGVLPWCPAVAPCRSLPAWLEPRAAHNTVRNRPTLRRPLPHPHSGKLDMSDHTVRLHRALLRSTSVSRQCRPSRRMPVPWTAVKQPRPEGVHRPEPIAQRPLAGQEDRAAVQAARVVAGAALQVHPTTAAELAVVLGRGDCNSTGDPSGLHDV